MAEITQEIPEILDYFYLSPIPVPPEPSSIENDAHGIEKLLLKLK